MDKLTINIKDVKVLKLINDLEALNLIEVIRPDLKKSKTKLSDLLSGCISPEQANIMHKELKEMRG
jgi:hypothetical protein